MSFANYLRQSLEESLKRLDLVERATEQGFANCLRQSLEESLKRLDLVERATEQGFVGEAERYAESLGRSVENSNEILSFTKDELLRRAEAQRVNLSRKDVTK